MYFLNLLHKHLYEVNILILMEVQCLLLTEMKHHCSCYVQDHALLDK